MTCFGITQPTADWLLGKTGVLDALHAVLLDAQTRSHLSAVEMVEGPIRFSSAGNVLVFWHADYLSGTGDEDWGFIELDGGFGLAGVPEISREVLEREIYVVNQRLQGYLIDGAFIHRAHPNGVHTCLAGRGTEARHYSVGYIERDVAAGASTVHAAVCSGPSRELSELTAATIKTGADLGDLVSKASLLIEPTRKRQAAPSDFLPELRRALAPYFQAAAYDEYGAVNVDTGTHAITDRDYFRTVGWTYRDWLNSNSCLSSAQRKILESNAVEKHPIRIVGPGGSGKTLLMQLLAISRLKLATEQGKPIRILYLAHNSKMAETIRHRFSVLQGTDDFSGGERELDVRTLAEYGRIELDLDENQVIDPDAHEAKEFQLDVIDGALEEAFAAHQSIVEQSPLFREVASNEALRPIMIRLIMSEISTAIKGHGLTNDPKRYIESERRLSRLHGVLTPDERRVIFDTFRRYHRFVFEECRVLDSDDIALSLLGKLRSPIWELKRRELGYDFLFVDETQLFNENERRLFSFITKSTLPHVPIVLALDEAQDLYGQTSAGFAALGIANVASENLSSIHRSTRAIVKLAFFVIQRSTDLFGPDFPDFTGIAEQMEDDTQPPASPPVVTFVPEDQDRLGRFVVKRIRSMRKQNLRRIAVICYAEQHWSHLLDELRKTDLPLRVLENRGERLPAGEPVVALSRPPDIGGQEFDAVILTGLEAGVVPPRVLDNDALAVAVEQQLLRELYLGITRARFQLEVVVSRGAAVTPVLASAQTAGALGARAGEE
ncbi:MAG TPA: UvrD-helicase domain-containing protein [Gemmatimonadaceae bacterium]|jgi:superfamily I DNA/RNA helicase